MTGLDRRCGRRVRCADGAARLSVVVGVGLIALAVGLVLSSFLSIFKPGGGQEVNTEDDVLLEPADAVGTDPFIPPPPPLPSSRSRTAPSPASPVVGESTVCDAEQMARDLQAQPSAAAAWTAALNADPTFRWRGGRHLDVSEIALYLGGLRPGVLERDLRVTNHRFEDGRPRAFQSVLQSGTHVLVDQEGVARVRCECSNPLLPMRAISGSPDYIGTPWPGFQPIPEVPCTDATGSNGVCEAPVAPLQSMPLPVVESPCEIGDECGVTEQEGLIVPPAPPSSSSEVETPVGTDPGLVASASERPEAPSAEPQPTPDQPPSTAPPPSTASPPVPAPSVETASAGACEDINRDGICD